MDDRGYAAIMPLAMKIISEVYPGAKADIDRMVEDAGGWRCEEHPDKPWPHDDCPGPGFIEDPDDG